MPEEKSNIRSNPNSIVANRSYFPSLNTMTKQELTVVLILLDKEYRDVDNLKEFGICEADMIRYREHINNKKAKVQAFFKDAVDDRSINFIL